MLTQLALCVSLALSTNSGIDVNTPLFMAELAMLTPTRAWTTAELVDFLGYMLPDPERTRRLIADNAIDGKSFVMLEFEHDLHLPGLFESISALQDRSIQRYGVLQGLERGAESTSTALTNTRTTSIINRTILTNTLLPPSWLIRLFVPPIPDFDELPGYLPQIRAFSDQEKDQMSMALIFHHSPRSRDDVGALYADYLAVLKCWAQKHDLAFIVDQSTLQDLSFLN